MSEILSNNVNMQYAEGDFLAERLKGFTTNRAYLSGYLEEKFQFSHTNHGYKFYRSVLRVPRLSGIDDHIPIMISDDIAQYKTLAQMEKGEFIEVDGRFTSYNEQGEDGKRHLSLYLYASVLNGEIPEEEQCIQRRNFIFLNGTICKSPIFRRTPLGKQILDLMVAVNRKYGRADYIPCIAWGTVAERYSLQFEIGSEICLWGRMQSRTYTKRLESGVSEKRITREISIMRIIEE